MELELRKLSWEHFKGIFNAIGWDKYTLASAYVNNAEGTYFDKGLGRLIVDMDDPRKGDSDYYIFLKDKEPIGLVILWEGLTMTYIGDFEIFQNHKGKGYGRAMLEKVLDSHKDRMLMLNYENRTARSFWEHMGFTLSTINTTLLELKN